MKNTILWIHLTGRVGQNPHNFPTQHKVNIYIYKNVWIKSDNVIQTLSTFPGTSIDNIDTLHGSYHILLEKIGDINKIHLLIEKLKNKDSIEREQIRLLEKQKHVHIEHKHKQTELDIYINKLKTFISCPPKRDINIPLTGIKNINM